MRTETEVREQFAALTARLGDPTLADRFGHPMSGAREALAWALGDASCTPLEFCGPADEIGPSIAAMVMRETGPHSEAQMLDLLADAGYDFEVAPGEVGF